MKAQQETLNQTQEPKDKIQADASRPDLTSTLLDMPKEDPINFKSHCRDIIQMIEQAIVWVDSDDPSKLRNQRAFSYSVQAALESCKGCLEGLQAQSQGNLSYTLQRAKLEAGEVNEHFKQQATAHVLQRDPQLRTWQQRPCTQLVDQSGLLHQSLKEGCISGYSSTNNFLVNSVDGGAGACPGSNQYKTHNPKNGLPGQKVEGEDGGRLEKIEKDIKSIKSTLLETLKTRETNGGAGSENQPEIEELISLFSETLNQAVEKPSESILGELRLMFNENFARVKLSFKDEIEKMRLQAEEIKAILGLRFEDFERFSSWVIKEGEGRQIVFRSPRQQTSEVEASPEHAEDALRRDGEELSFKGSLVFDQKTQQLNSGGKLPSVSLDTRQRATSFYKTLNRKLDLLLFSKLPQLEESLESQKGEFSKVLDKALLEERKEEDKDQKISDVDGEKTKLTEKADGGREGFDGGVLGEKMDKIQESLASGDLRVMRIGCQVLENSCYLRKMGRQLGVLKPKIERIRTLWKSLHPSQSSSTSILNRIETPTTKTPKSTTQIKAASFKNQSVYLALKDKEGFILASEKNGRIQETNEGKKSQKIEIAN